MKFGAVPASKLAAIDLHLPPEPFMNTLVLPGIRAAQPKVYIGSAHWGDASWNGSIYPLNTSASQYRQLYPQHFNAIELNATHYNIYTPAVMRQWAAPASGKDFRFCPKFPQQISHHSGFQNTDGLTDAFLQSITAFENHLGPVFLQLSETFSPDNKEVLFDYLAALPKHLTFFLEVRHPAWFSDMKEKEILFTTLYDLGIGAVITDAPGRRDVVHMHITLPKLFLRFVCNAIHPTSYSRTDEWVQHIQPWIDAGMEEVYVFLHPGHTAAVPELASYWVQQINTHCGLALKEPVPIQPRLF